MKEPLLQYLLAQRQIFGICPECNNLFRLSDFRISSIRRPKPDWLDRLSSAEDAVWEQQKRLSEAEEEIRYKARERGRRKTARVVRKLDHVFAPRRIAPEDVVGIFHPIDYLVFEKQSGGETKGLVFLDRNNRGKEELRLQRSIEVAVRRQRYEWKTLRISEAGDIDQEE